MVNVIAAIEEKLQAQKDEIFFKDLQISELKKKLEAAEIELEEANGTIRIIEEEYRKVKGAAE